MIASEALILATPLHSRRAPSFLRTLIAIVLVATQVALGATILPLLFRPQRFVVSQAVVAIERRLHDRCCACCASLVTAIVLLCLIPAGLPICSTRLAVKLHIARGRGTADLLVVAAPPQLPFGPALRNASHAIVGVACRAAVVATILFLRRVPILLPSFRSCEAIEGQRGECGASFLDFVAAERLLDLDPHVFGALKAVVGVAPLRLLLAAPLLLADGPACFPVHKPRGAVVGDSRRVGAALLLVPATPSFFLHRPTTIRVGQASGAVVGIANNLAVATISLLVVVPAIQPIPVTCTAVEDDGPGRRAAAQVLVLTAPLLFVSGPSVGNAGRAIKRLACSMAAFAAILLLAIGPSCQPISSRSRAVVALDGRNRAPEHHLLAAPELLGFCPAGQGVREAFLAIVRVATLPSPVAAKNLLALRPTGLPSIDTSSAIVLDRCGSQACN
mmetsp:Transcript_106802/g.341135  ORF Transcript_106802/g.341135 Transcript_106802/m.341135 type:complete len:447 (-) Transcript_106802:2025-3365(-)